MQTHTLRADLLARGQTLLRTRRELLESGDSLECAIMAFIEEGVNTRDAIIRSVPKLVGHTYPHVARVLDLCTGDDPEMHYWYRDQMKRYRIHAEPKAKARRRRVAKGTVVGGFNDDLHDDVPF